MAAYYNEIDHFAAEWLRNLISKGLIADGEVDTRSIVDVRPDDISGFRQCHFFAGIGVWSYAARRAGVSDDRSFWSASCPCQPFSAAGKGGGFDDERHLWPHLHWLIEQCRPDVVVGEQVASKDGLGWLDLIQADLEGANYTSAAVDMCSAGFGAPHIRQRLYWMAYAHERRQSGPWFVRRPSDTARDVHREVDRAFNVGRGGGVAYASSGVDRSIGSQPDQRAVARGDGAVQAEFGLPGPTNGFWRDADWLLCRDGKWRPVEPGTFPLAHGATSRVGRLRAYGNAINAEQATEFMKAAIYLI